VTGSSSHIPRIAIRRGRSAMTALYQNVSSTANNRTVANRLC